MPLRRQTCAGGGTEQCSGCFWGVDCDGLKSWDWHWEQLQTREGRSVIVDLIGKGRRLRTVPVPLWCKQLVDAWPRHSGVSEGKIFRRISKFGKRQQAGVTANVVWYAVKRCAQKAGIANLAPHGL